MECLREKLLGFVLALLFSGMAHALPRVPASSNEVSHSRNHTPRLVPVLTFHDLVHHFDKTSILTPVKRFTQMLRYLERKHYQTFFVSEIPKLLAGKCRRLRRGWNPVVITFDDGYVNNYRLLLPVLRKHNCKVTIFLIVSKVVDKRASAKSNALTWFEVRKMAKTGHIEFGSHTFALHYNLAQLERLCSRSKRFSKQVHLDLYTSRIVLESEIGCPVKSLAWPYGKRSKHLIALAKKAGFSMLFNTQFAVIEPTKHNLLDLPRLNTSTPYMTASSLHRRLQKSLIQGSWSEKMRARRLLAKQAKTKH